MNRLPFKAARKVNFILAVSQIGDRRQMNRRLGGDHPGDGCGFAAVCPCSDVASSLPTWPEGDDDNALVTHPGPVNSHILDTRTAGPRDDVRRNIRRFVLSRSPGDDRQGREACHFTHQDIFLTCAGTDRLWLYRGAERSNDFIVDVLDVT